MSQNSLEKTPHIATTPNASGNSGTRLLISQVVRVNLSSFRAQNQYSFG